MNVDNAYWSHILLHNKKEINAGFEEGMSMKTTERLGGGMFWARIYILFHTISLKNHLINRK